MKEESTETFLSEQDEGYDLFSYIEDEDINKIEDFLKISPIYGNIEIIIMINQPLFILLFSKII